MSIDVSEIRDGDVVQVEQHGHIYTGPVTVTQHIISIDAARQPLIIAVHDTRGWVTRNDQSIQLPLPGVR